MTIILQFKTSGDNEMGLFQQTSQSLRYHTQRLMTHLGELQQKITSSLANFWLSTNWIGAMTSARQNFFSHEKTHDFHCVLHLGMYLYIQITYSLTGLTDKCVRWPLLCLHNPIMSNVDLSLGINKRMYPLLYCIKNALKVKKIVCCL